MNLISVRRLALTMCVALGLPLTAFAQTSTTTTVEDDGPDVSYIPYTYKGYWGVSLGKSSFDTDCDPAFECEDPNISGKIYIGGQINKWLGVEIGYIHLGTQHRNGGDTDAQAINIGLVGTLPLNQSFNLFGKIGTNYSWTETEPVAAGSDGKEVGWGVSYGLGAAYNYTNRTQIIAEWGRHEIQFVDEVNGVDVDVYSIGLRFRF